MSLEGIVEEPREGNPIPLQKKAPGECWCFRNALVVIETFCIHMKVELLRIQSRALLCADIESKVMTSF